MARQRTIGFKGTIDGDYIIKYTVPGPAAPFFETAEVVLDINAFGARLRLIPDYYIGGTSWWKYWAFAWGDFPSGSPNTDVEEHTPTGSSETWTLDLAGTWRIELDTEEAVIEQFLADFPVYGGPYAPDMLQESLFRYIEKARAGVSLTATLTCGSLSVTQTRTFAAITDIPDGHRPSFSASAWAWNVSAITADILTSAVFFYDTGGGDVDIALSIPAWTPTATGHAADGNMVHATATPFSSGGTSICPLTQVSTSRTPDRSWEFRPRIRKMEDAYGADANWRVDRAQADLAALVTGGNLGTVVDNFAQKRYNAQAVFADYVNSTIFVFSGVGTRNLYGIQPGNPAPVDVDEWQNFRCWLDSAWIAAQSEDARDWRTPVLLPDYDAGTLAHDTNYVIEDGTDLGWANVQNVTISDSGGYLQLAVSGGEGIVDLTFATTGLEASPKDDWQAHRTLSITLQANGVSKPYTIEVNAKTWAGTTNATANTDETDTFDLQAPHNNVATLDATDSRWPVGNEGPLFGVNHTTKIRLKGLENGVTYKIDQIKLTRTTRARMSLALAFEKWTPTGTGADYNRHVTVEVDGHLAGEVTGVYRNGMSYTAPTLAQVFTTLNDQRNGWTGVAGSPTDPFFNLSRPLFWLGSPNGQTWNGSAWVDWFDRDVTSALTLVVQGVADSIEWYPYCGDPHMGVYQEKTPMVVPKTLQGEAWGNTIDNTAHVGLAGETVTISGLPDSADPQTTDALGFYRSEPRRASDGIVAHGSNSLSIRIRNRYRVTANFAKDADTVPVYLIQAALHPTQIPVIACMPVGGGNLEAAVHPGAVAAIANSDGTQGFRYFTDTYWKVITEDVDDFGLAILPTARVFFCYDLAAAGKQKTSDNLLDTLSSESSASPDVRRHSSNGRAIEQAYRFRALGGSSPIYSGSGDIKFSQCRDSAGTLWTTEVTVVTGATGRFCGGVWTGAKWGCLYRKDSNGKAYWIETTDPSSWPAAPGTDVSADVKKYPVGLVALPSGVLVGITWDVDSTFKVFSCHSHDQGATWDEEGTEIKSIPALSTPPAILAFGGYILLYWREANQQFMAWSKNGGLTFQK